MLWGFLASAVSTGELVRVGVLLVAENEEVGFCLLKAGNNLTNFPSRDGGASMAATESGNSFFDLVRRNRSIGSVPSAMKDNQPLTSIIVYPFLQTVESQ